MQPHSNLDSEQVTRFLKLIDPSDTKFTFQTFHDKKPPTNKDLIRVVQSPGARPTLLELHARDAGIYLTINQTNGLGRKSENITRIRAVWMEDDDGFAGPLPLTPSMIVESSPGHCHRYWLVADDWPADEADFAAVMERMVESYGSDKNAKDICRVLRVPGFLHRKSTPHLVRIIEASGKRYTRAQILEAFPPIPRQQKQSTQRKWTAQDHDDERIRDALRHINPDDRKVWCDIGMSIKNHLGESGRPLWDNWSQQSSNYDAKDQDKSWLSFKRDGIGIGTLFHYAKDAQESKSDWQQKINGYDTGGASIDGPTAEATLPLGDIFTFLGDAPAAPPRELIKKLLPADGVVILGGQSSAGKTFAAIHLTKCLAAGLAFFEHKIVERVGTAFVAAEGAALINNRFAASLAKDSITEKLPVAWLKQMPDFATADGQNRFIRQLKELDKRYRDDFGVRLGQFIIDTITASFTMKSEDDNAEATKVCNLLRQVYQETGALAVAAHHYGKNPESGLRGASAFRGCAEVVLGVLADIDPLSGRASNRELVCAKARDGEQGPLSPFNLEYIELGIDSDHDSYGSCCVVPMEGESRFDMTKKMSKVDKVFQEAWAEASDGLSQIIVPRAGMPQVRGVKIMDIRPEFYRRYVVAEADPKKAGNSKRMAFTRALDRLSPTQFGAGSVEGQDWVWKI